MIIPLLEQIYKQVYNILETKVLSRWCLTAQYQMYAQSPKAIGGFGRTAWNVNFENIRDESHNLTMEEKRLQTRFSTVVSILIYIFPSFGSRWNLYFIKLFPTWPFQAFPYICQVWFNMTFKKELFWLFLVRDPCATSVSLALSILLHIN